MRVRIPLLSVGMRPQICMTPLFHRCLRDVGLGEMELTTYSYGNALLTFDPKAEARLRWKIDLYIIPTVALLYLFCFIDRANIGNARLAGLEKDLKLKGYDYNQVLSIFYISYIIFEVSNFVR